MSRAILFALSEPGSQVSLQEYTDWYQNEHIPLRMDNNLPEFETGARFSAADGVTPTYLAMYELSSSKILADERYTTLNQNRSEREASIMGRLEALQRRQLRIVWDSGRTTKPLTFFRTIFVRLDPGKVSEYNRYYEEEHLEALRKVPGWRRTIRVEVDSSSSGSFTHGVFYEYDSQESLKTSEYKEGASTPWSKKVIGSLPEEDVEKRNWNIIKQFRQTATLS